MSEETQIKIVSERDQIKKVTYLFELGHDKNPYAGEHVGRIYEDASSAISMYRELQERHPGKEIKITRVVETMTISSISLDDLQRYASQK